MEVGRQVEPKSSISLSVSPSLQQGRDKVNRTCRQLVAHRQGIAGEKSVKRTPSPLRLIKDTRQNKDITRDQ